MKNNEAELIGQYVGTVQKFLRGYLIRKKHVEQLATEKVELKLRPEVQEKDLDKEVEKLERVRKLELQMMQ